MISLLARCSSPVRTGSCLSVLLLAFFQSVLHGAVFLSPPSSTNLVGSVIELTLLDDGQIPEDGFGFSWSKGGAPVIENDRVSGTNGPVLRINYAELDDTGSYSVTFTNLVGTNLTRQVASAAVFVVAEPAFAGDIVSESRGTDVTFRVNATGGLLSYQWFWQGQPVFGATNSSIHFTNAYANANAGYYTVRVSNPASPDGVFAERPVLISKPTPGGTYQGIFYNEDELAQHSSGSIQFNLAPTKRTFSGKLLLGTLRYSFSGQFTAEHYVEVTASSKQAEPLLLRLQLLTMNDAPQVTGTVQGAEWTSNLRAHRLAFSAQRPTTLAGRYTLALQNTNMSYEVPNGDGCGSAIINSNGIVKFKGKAPDGTAITQSAGLSSAGDWPLYIVTHKGRGSVLGWLRVARQSGRSISGPWTAYLKDQGPDKLYPDGFAMLLQPTGSSYVPPITNYIAGITNGVAAIYGGDLFSEDVPLWSFIRVNLRPPSRFVAERSPERLQLKVSQGIGLMSGSFVNPVTGKRSAIHAAILQQQAAVRGLFISQDRAGSFSVVRE